MFPPVHSLIRLLPTAGPPAVPLPVLLPVLPLRPLALIRVRGPVRVRAFSPVTAPGAVRGRTPVVERGRGGARVCGPGSGRGRGRGRASGRAEWPARMRWSTGWGSVPRRWSVASRGRRLAGQAVRAADRVSIHRPSAGGRPGRGCCRVRRPWPARGRPYGVAGSGARRAGRPGARRRPGRRRPRERCRTRLQVPGAMGHLKPLSGMRPALHTTSRTRTREGGREAAAPAGHSPRVSVGGSH